MNRLSFVCLFVLLGSLSTFADEIEQEFVIVTLTGKSFQGSIVDLNKDTVVLKTKDGEQKIEMSNVESMRRFHVDKQLTVEQRSRVATYLRNYRNAGWTIPFDAEADDKTERLLLLVPGGPLVIDVEVTIDGNPFRQFRERVVGQFMQLADGNKDGKLTWIETFSYPTFTRGRFAAVKDNEEQRKRMIAQLDFDKDGLTDKMEMRFLVATLYSGSAFSILNYASRYGMNATSPIERVLDVNEDKQLSGDEIAGASKRLKSRDANDDDVLTLAELTGVSTNPYQRQAYQPAPRIVHHLCETTNWSEVYQALAAQYGKDGKFKREDLTLTPKLFEGFDKNGNGIVDGNEFSRFLEIPPHMVVSINLGKKGDDVKGITLKSIDKELNVLDQAESRVGGKLLFELPGCNLELIAGNMQSVFTNNAGDRAKAMIRQYDTDKNEYLEKKELKSQPTFERQFDYWDANRDGKLYADELTAVYERSYGYTTNRISVGAVNRGHWMFSALDMDKNGSLSLREMITSPDNLKSSDKNKDGKISPDEVSTTIRLAVAQGNYANQFLSEGGRAMAGRYSAQPVRPSTEAPEWFMRMDRNRDGDITRREFLGNEEQFKKLDTNNDGFIERKEAKASLD